MAAEDKIRFHHGIEAYKLRDVLAKENIGIATWADWWGGKLELWDGIPQNIGLLTEAGVHAHMHSDSEYGIQRLNQEAGKALRDARAMGLKLTEDDVEKGIDEARANSLVDSFDFKDRLLWVDVQKNGTTLYTGAFNHWFDRSTVRDGAGAVEKS